MGRFYASKVTLQLIKTKCLPVLLYGFEACPLTKLVLKSLSFVINRYLTKLFTKVLSRVGYFGFSLPSELRVNRVSIVYLNLNRASSVLSVLLLF